MQRTAHSYDLGAAQVLDGWLIPDAPRSSVEYRVLQAGAAELIAMRMRAPLRTLEAMIPVNERWLVSNQTDAAVCPQCLSEDDGAGRPRYRRTHWAQAWRIRCARHKARLVNLPEWHCSDLRAWRQAPRHRRNARGAIVDLGHGHGARNAHVSLPRVSKAIGALVQIESAIACALSGRRPSPVAWGPLDSEAFLRVVLDVSCFVLSCFDRADRQPLCACAPVRFHDPGPSRCFLRQPPMRNPAPQGLPMLVDLAHAGSVGWRRCALFWCRELMHARSAVPGHRPWDPRDRHHRQSTVLARASAPAIDWLATRALDWPPAYRSARWRSFTCPQPG